MSVRTIVSRTLESGVSELLEAPTDLVLLDRPAPRGNLSWMAIVGGAPSALVQAPLVPEATRADFLRGLERVESLLGHPAARDALGSRLPRPLAAIEIQRRAPDGSAAASLRFHAWAWCEGHARLPATIPDRRALLSAASETLRALRKARSVLGLARPAEELEIRGSVESWAERVADLAPRDAVEAAIERFSRGAGALSMGLTHGDFWWGNLLRRPAGETVLLDWEESSDDGPTWLDPMMFALTLILDLEADPRARPGRPEDVLAWAAGEAAVAPSAVPDGLLLAALAKAERERRKYGQHETPVQRWIRGRTAARGSSGGTP
jgi:aminoglycoside phosphotransferase (APT) family kinase protein